MHRPSDSSPAVLAFDLGGTRLKAGLVRGAEVSSLIRITLENDSNGESLVEHLLEVGQQLLALDKIQAIGIGVRGIVDSPNGTILDVKGPLSNLIGYPLARTIAQKLGSPTVMENDARMYALGEWLHGSGQGCSNLVCLTLGTGVGSGVVLNRRVLRGARHVSGILGGHFTVQVDGPLCSCGNRGCLEALIGTPALVQMARDILRTSHSSLLREQSLTPLHIFEAAAASDLLASEVVERFAEILGAGIVSMIHAYDPDKVVLGGGFMSVSAQFLPTVQAYVDAHVWSIPRGRIRVTPALLGDAAALVGVAELSSNEQLLL